MLATASWAPAGGRRTSADLLAVYCDRACVCWWLWYEWVGVRVLVFVFNCVCVWAGHVGGERQRGKRSNVRKFTGRSTGRLINSLTRLYLYVRVCVCVCLRPRTRNQTKLICISTYVRTYVCVCLSEPNQNPNRALNEPKTSPSGIKLICAYTYVRTYVRVSG